MPQTQTLDATPDGANIELPADRETRMVMLGIWLTVDAPDPDDEDSCGIDLG